LWQWQTGVQYAFLRSPTERQDVYVFENQLRYGLTDDLEIALLLNADQTSNEQLEELVSEAGFSTLGLRLRNHVFQGQGVLSAVGWQFDLLFPYYGEFTQGTHMGGHLTGMVELNLGWNLGVSLNGGIRWTGEIARPLGNYVLNINYSLNRYSFFVEHFSTQLPDGSWPLWIDGGLAFQVQPHFVLDFSLGTQSSAEAQTVFFNTGFSWRWE
jgi:hypothetical protein